MRRGEWFLDKFWIESAKRLETDLADYRKLRMSLERDTSAGLPDIDNDSLTQARAQLNRRYAQLAAFALGLPDADIAFDCDLESAAEQRIGAEGLRCVFGASAVSSVPPYISVELSDYAKKNAGRSIAADVPAMPAAFYEDRQAIHPSIPSTLLADHLSRKYADRIPLSERVLQNSRIFAGGLVSLTNRNGAAHVQTVECRIGCSVRLGATESKYDMEKRNADLLPSFCNIK